MPRQVIPNYPNALYHVMSRGVNKQHLFETIDDYKMFLYLLGETCIKFGVIILCFCIMPNHYHIFLQTPNANLSEAMKFLNQSYANYFLATRKNKVGHVFGSRFKKKLVECELYAKTLFRYISLNPVKAKLVENPADWAWSSYKNYIFENQMNYRFLQKELIYNLFSYEKKQAIKYIKDYCNVDIEKLIQPSWGKTEIARRILL